ncbi:ABC transporter permease subunit [Clostridium oryzae]|uniref:ABC-2 family transporter protein n=1 Tax=Clostridium oryzae TaxID=1450648 RepID=A0A1V4IBW5_9CLOT|nr:ABC transporter permease subunit [Clostridium oryzae]OPJ57423.1 ABC-2 family transporter protein [Clostridium oryzae]
MMILIKNELIKLMSRKKTIVVTIAFAILTALLIFGIYKDNKTNRYYNSPQHRLESLNSEMSYLQNDKKNHKNDKTELEDINGQIVNVKNQIKQVKDQMNTKIDWKTKLDNNIKSYKQQLTNSKLDEGNKASIKADLDKLQYLKQHNIKPQDDLTLNSVLIIQKIIGILGLIFLPIGIVMFSSDMVSGEYTPPTMKVLLTQPVSRAKVLASKFIAVTLSAIVLIVGIELIYFIITGLMFGFGNLNYPMMVGGKYHYDKMQLMRYGTKMVTLIYNSLHVIPTWQYLIQLFGLNILYIVSASAFCFLVSTVMKSSMVSMATGSVFIIAVLVLSEAVQSIHKITQFIFLSYGNVDDLITGGIAVGFKNPNVNLELAVIVMVVWGVLSYVISHIVFTKKDILI